MAILCTIQFMEFIITSSILTQYLKGKKKKRKKSFVCCCSEFFQCGVINRKRSNFCLNFTFSQVNDHRNASQHRFPICVTAHRRVVFSFPDMANAVLPDTNIYRTLIRTLRYWDTWSRGMLMLLCLGRAVQSRLSRFTAHLSTMTGHQIR